MVTELDVVKYEDWSGPPKQLKPHVDDLKVALNLEL